MINSELKGMDLSLVTLVVGLPIVVFVPKLPSGSVNKNTVACDIALTSMPLNL